MRGKSKIPEYWIWQRMKQRCFDEKVAEYQYYGGKGVKVCERWMTFENFYEDMGKRPDGMTLDRINSDGDYEPSNCRWASRREQAINRTMTRWITYGGERKCMKDWARTYGIPLPVLKYRLDAGWPVELALGL